MERKLPFSREVPKGEGVKSEQGYAVSDRAAKGFLLNDAGGGAIVQTGEKHN